MNLLALALDRVPAAIGGPKWRDVSRAIQVLNKQWLFDNVNDGEVLAGDPRQEETRAANALLKTDPDAALPRLLSLADLGSTWSMFLLGWSFETGTGAVQSLAEAERWYRRSAQRGCLRAVLELGRLLQRRGDVEGQEHLYLRPADAGWAPACFLLGRLRLGSVARPKNLKAVGPLLRVAADQGSPEAQWLLARLAVDGRFGLAAIMAGHRDMWRFAERWSAAILQEAEPEVAGAG